MHDGVYNVQIMTIRLLIFMYNDITWREYYYDNAFSAHILQTIRVHLRSELLQCTCNVSGDISTSTQPICMIHSDYIEICASLSKCALFLTMLSKSEFEYLCMNPKKLFENVRACRVQVVENIWCARMAFSALQRRIHKRSCS